MDHGSEQHPAKLDAGAVRLAGQSYKAVVDLIFGRPSTINEGRSFAATISSEALPLDALQKIVELTRGLVPLPDHTSGLPHIRE